LTNQRLKLSFGMVQDTRGLDGSWVLFIVEALVFRVVHRKKMMAAMQRAAMKRMDFFMSIKV